MAQCPETCWTHALMSCEGEWIRKALNWESLAEPRDGLTPPSLCICAECVAVTVLLCTCSTQVEMARWAKRQWSSQPSRWISRATSNTALARRQRPRGLVGFVLEGNTGNILDCCGREKDPAGHRCSLLRIQLQLESMQDPQAMNHPDKKQ